MNGAHHADLNVLYNAGLERGRRAQTISGHNPPAGVYARPDAERDAYLDGWQKGNDTVTRLDLLRRAV